MSAKVKFVPDLTAEAKIRSAAGSMANVGLAIRMTADRIRDTARGLAQADALGAVTRRDALKAEKRPEQKDFYLQAKAEAYALGKHASMINAYETGGKGAEVVGHVVADYAASAAIEFGGTDTNVKLGFAEDAKSLQHRAHGHLGRALRSSR